MYVGEIRAAAHLADDRAGQLIWSLYVLGFVEVATVVVTLWSMLAGNGDSGYWLVGLLLGALLTLVVGIQWLSWFKPLYAAVVAAGRARFASGGMWFWAWVIPVACYILPKYLVNDVCRAADEPGRERPLPGRVLVWWYLWAGSGLVMSLGSRADFDGGAHPVAAALVLLVHFGTAFLAARAVPVLTDRVLLLADRVESGAYNAGVEPPSTGITQPVT